MKVILKCDKDKLSQAMMAAQELITVYQTKMGTEVRQYGNDYRWRVVLTVVVRQNDSNRA